MHTVEICSVITGQRHQPHCTGAKMAGREKQSRILSDVLESYFACVGEMRDFASISSHQTVARPWKFAKAAEVFIVNGLKLIKSWYYFCPIPQCAGVFFAQFRDGLTPLIVRKMDPRRFWNICYHSRPSGLVLHFAAFS